MTGREMYCGAAMGPALCLLPEHIGEDTHDTWTEHPFVPAYVRCPECGGFDIMYAMANRGATCPRCATTPTPGFIPAEEAQP